MRCPALTFEDASPAGNASFQYLQRQKRFNVLLPATCCWVPEGDEHGDAFCYVGFFSQFIREKLTPPLSDLSEVNLSVFWLSLEPIKKMIYLPTNTKLLDVHLTGEFWIIKRISSLLSLNSCAFTHCALALWPGRQRKYNSQLIF